MYNVTVKEFALMLSVTDRTVRNWLKQGLPHEKHKGILNIDLIPALQWHLQNTSSSPFKPDLNNAEYDLEDLSVEDQLRVKRIEKLDLDIAIQKGDFIPINEVDETTSQFVALLINQYRQHMRLLPHKLAKKTESQIKKLLDSTFSKSINSLQEIFNKEAELENRE